MSKKDYILGIETSCDDTSLALLSEGKIIWEKTMTSLDEHKKFGGIIPEISARRHEQDIQNIFHELKEKYDISRITHIGYTSEPGLPGSLHIGKTFASFLSFLNKSKLVKVNHMYGHIFSPFVNKSKNEIKFPALGLVISGANTIIYLIKSYKKIIVLNKTTDNAIGDILDKIGRELKYDYPGGVNIDKKYNSKKVIDLISHHTPSDNFSFSGIYNYCLKLIKQKKDSVTISSSLLKWISDELVMKIEYYAKVFNIKNIFVGGGVSANTLISSSIKNIPNCNVYICERKYSGDNAAMIANYTNYIV